MNDTCAMHDCDEPVEHLVDTVFCRKHHTESVAKNATKEGPIDLGNLGTVEVPEAERLDEPWIFRAACHLKQPSASTGVLLFGLILDLGFHTYRQIHCLLDGYLLREGAQDLAVEFALNWAENGHPNPLEVYTLKRNGDLWHVHLYRVELEFETLKALGRVSLGDALEEQGLVMKIAEAEPDA